MSHYYIFYRQNYTSIDRYGSVGPSIIKDREMPIEADRQLILHADQACRVAARLAAKLQARKIRNAGSKKIIARKNVLELTFAAICDCLFAFSLTDIVT
jgi:hypothetical protein